MELIDFKNILGAAVVSQRKYTSTINWRIILSLIIYGMPGGVRHQVIKNK